MNFLMNKIGMKAKTMIDTEKYYVHTNTWWWGISYSIARKDGVGLIEIQFDNDLPETAYVKGLSVMKCNRKQGVGSEMLSLCEDVARQKGMSFLRISVEKNNNMIFEWYKRKGFHVLCVDEHVFEMIKFIV